MIPSKPSPLIRLEADLPLEYFPFSAAEVVADSCDDFAGTLMPYCGLVLNHRTSCSCWINLPTWKTSGWFPKVIAKLQTCRCDLLISFVGTVS